MRDMPANDLGVIYLCRFAEGEEPVRQFLTTYRAHPAGVDHDFHVVFKGFTDQASLARFRTLFDGLAINAIEVDDTGFDLGAYVKAARSVTNKRVIFLNTFSRIEGDNWLRLFDNAMNQPNVGVAGATGSWQSNAASYERVLKRIGLELWRKLPFVPPAAAQAVKTANLEVPWAVAMKPRPMSRYVYALWHWMVLLYEFGRHPNKHLRTNAFMVNREQFLSLDLPAFKDKKEAYRFESGRKSLTRQYMKRGLASVVVGRNGAVYPADQWNKSSTFWMNKQANLLVGDNRTLAYAEDSSDMQAYLEHIAWRDPWTGR